MQGTIAAEIPPRAVRRHHGIDVKLRKEVMVHVDSRLGSESLRGCRRHAAKRQAHGSRANQEAPPRRLCRDRRRIAAHAGTGKTAS